MINLKIPLKNFTGRCLQSQLSRLSSTSKSDGEYSQNVLYPPILSLSESDIKRRERDAKYLKYRELKSVEEKMFAYNIPKYYGWNNISLIEGEYPFGILPFYQHITRTGIVKIDSIDDFYKLTACDKDLCKTVLERLRKPIQEAILFELKGRRYQYKDKGPDKISDVELQNSVSRLVINQINRTILSDLCREHPYLLESTVDYDARVEAWWLVGGFYHGPGSKIGGKRYTDDDPKDPAPKAPEDGEVEHTVQFRGSPSLQVRLKDPLKPLNTANLPDGGPPSVDSIPVANSDPLGSYGVSFERRNGTNIAGYWPGDANEFGLLSYHVCGHLLGRPPHFGPKDSEDTLTAQGLMASFSWLMAQAYYQGFSTYHELTYPLVTQNVITDGHRFKMSLYQLNTVVTHSDNFKTNPRANVCLTSPFQPLFMDIDDSNQFKGWNDAVLEWLLMFYLNKPSPRDADMKPYVDKNESYIKDIEDPKRREWLHDQFRYMYSCRPRTRLPYEIYDWERIYKIEFQYRPIEARFRPFELNKDPLEDRKYYEHMPPYVPKSQRSKKYHWKVWRSHFAQTYYPEID